VIELRDVRVELPGREAPALDGIGFVLQPGERAALLGGNGSGKTTLARLLNGTQLPTAGSVHVDRHDTRDAATRLDVRRAVGLLFQDPDDQFVSTTVEREIAFGLENARAPVAELRRAVDAALVEFDLESHRQSAPHELSGGEKARLALACVWVMQPRYLVLDETESLLDRRGRERLSAALAALPAETTILHVTTHAEVAARCARVLVLHAGRLVADGAPNDVMAGLNAETRVRTGLPIAWRVSSALTDLGKLSGPTACVDSLTDSVLRAPTQTGSEGARPAHSGRDA
jgi:energy-coupling factor transport system ATP-binding protein